MITFWELWAVQAEQQRLLGLDPQGMTQVQARNEMNALLANLHEETADLGRNIGTYKNHLLNIKPGARHDTPEAVADVLKTLLAIAQLAGVTHEELLKAFQEKTELIAGKVQAANRVLSHDKKIACFDLDDVIFDLGDLKERFGFAQNGRQEPDWALSGPEVIRSFEALKAEFYTSDGFRRLRPVVGAQSALCKFRDRNWMIVLITARPQWQYKRIYLDTLYALNLHGIPFDLLLFSRNKVEAVCEHLAPGWPRFFVEDHERNALDLARSGVRVLLFDRPWNSHIGDGKVGDGSIQRVRGWEDVLSVLETEEGTEK